MGLLRRWYSKRELSRAVYVFEELVPGELVISTQVSTLASPWGPYAEGYLVLTTLRLGFRSTVGPGFGVVTGLAAVAHVEDGPSPASHHVGVRIRLTNGDVIAGSTSNDFLTIFLFAVATVQQGERIDDPEGLIRDALTAWDSSQ